MKQEVLRAATFSGLDTATLYALLRLRAEVFVVEQECAYLDLDGLDTAPDTLHLWVERDGEPVGYLRILKEPSVLGAPSVLGEPTRIGRVVVAKHARGDGLAGRLMAAALDRIGEHPCALAAQSYLVGFYERCGFVVSGPEYIEDGIPHTPMIREAR